MQRFLQPLLVVGFFAAMMTLLVRDHLAPRWRNASGTPVSKEMLIDQWVGRDDWMQLRLNSLPIGGLRSTTDRRPEGGYLMTMQLAIDAPIVKGTLTTAVTLDQGLNVEQIRGDLDFSERGIPPVELAAVVQGRDMFLRIKSESGVKHHHLVLKRPVSVASVIDPMWMANSMEPGTTYSMDVYDPVWGMQAGEMRIRMGGVNKVNYKGHWVEARRIEESVANVRSFSWVTASGELVRRELQFFPDVAEEDFKSRPGRTATGPTLVLEKIEAQEGGRKYPSLVKLPPVPEYTVSDMQGKDSGEPLEALGVLPMLVRGRLESINKRGK